MSAGALPLPIWTSVVATHRRLRAANTDLPGDHPQRWPSGQAPLYHLCGLCGTLEVEGFTALSGEDFQVRLVTPDHCGQCRGMAEAYPELFVWVLHVMGNHAKWYDHPSHELTR